MAKFARDVMTSDPSCCTSSTPLDKVAQMMVTYRCGEIPIVDGGNRLIGVITDRDIVCRIVAEGKNPAHLTADSCMTTPAITVSGDTPLSEVILTMEKHQIRRVPVVDGGGCCTGIVAQADIAKAGVGQKTAELVSEISRDSPRAAL